jgi:hypothetical protein
LPTDDAAAAMTLKADDVVKVVVGVHIDGFAALDGETCAWPLLRSSEPLLTSSSASSSGHRA